MKSRPDWWARGLSCVILVNITKSTVLSMFWAALGAYCVWQHCLKDDD